MRRTRAKAVPLRFALMKMQKPTLERMLTAAGVYGTWFKVLRNHISADVNSLVLSAHDEF